MLIFVLLAVFALVAFALYSTTRGEGGNMVTEADLGGSNSYEAYYGKNRFSYAAGQPCDECLRFGCIGNGQCRCLCHQKAKA